MMSVPASASSFAKARPWAWYLAAALAATGLSVLLPPSSPASAAIYLAMNASVIGALAWGIRRCRPDPRAPWLALLAGYGLLLAANAARYANDPLAPLAGDSVSSGLYLAAYLAIAVSLALLARARGAVRDLRSLADAVIVVTGIATLWFAFLIVPVLLRPGIPPFERLVAISYPVPDLVFLILLLWLAFAKGPRGAVLPLLIAGIAAQAVADALLGTSTVDAVSTGGIERPLWLLSFALVGATALHPSLPLIGAKGDQPSWLPTGRRVYLLALVSLLVPLGLLRDSIAAGSAGGVIFGVTMTVLMLLIFARFRGLLVDVDIYARTQAQLTASEARFRRLVEQVPAVIYVDATDEATERRYVSPRYTELTGHSPEEAVAHPWLWSNQIHPDDREWVVAAARETNERDGPTTLEYRIIAADGSELWIRDEAIVIERDADGHPCAWQGVLEDITGAHRAEDEIRRLNAELEQRVVERTAELATANEHLREANSHVESLVATVPVILYKGCGPDRNVHDATEYFNLGVNQMLGFSPAEMMAPGFWVERLLPEDRERAIAEALEVRRRGLPTHVIDYRMVHRDGRVLWMHDVVSYTYEADGTWTSAGAVVDVTEQKSAEDELRRAKEGAERANRAKSEFLSSMSHELRTPLNAVLGFGQLLEHSTLSPDDRDSVAQVLRGGRTLLAMIDSVLDLARVESGQLTLSIEPLSVAELIAETLDLVRPAAARRGIQLVTPADVEPPPWALADRIRIKQVILNLLTNAVTYNREDGSVTVAYHVAAGNRLRLSVTDTGPGIPAERQATLFTPLDRRRGAESKPAGLGVGLALSARLLGAMNGSISVESEVGAGSTFSIELPLAAEPAVESGARSVPVTGAAAAATVVYVEDNLANLKLIERILDVRPGTRVLAAMQGSLGLDLARQHHPDLVLLDFHLPDIPGEDVLRLLRDDPATRDIPVIVLSSALGNGTGRRLLDLGATACFTKPIDVAAFLAAVERVLQGGVADA